MRHRCECATRPMACRAVPCHAARQLRRECLAVDVRPLLTHPHLQFLQLGTVCTSLWALEPLLPRVRPPAAVVQVPEPAPEAPTPPSKANKRKKNTPEKVAPAVVPSPTPRPQPEKTGSKLRIALLPLFPFLTSTILRGPTLPKPLLEPYTHPIEPLKILSSIYSSYSGVVVVGQTLQKSPNEVGNMDHLRYLRAGHSLLGGVWVGPKAHSSEDPTAVVTDEAGESLGDSIYSAFVLQEAARLVVKKPGNGTPKNALMMCVS